MASKQDVKRYLAYWFQLGKKVVVNNGAATLQPQVVLDNDRYSDEFEDCWQQIIFWGTGNCYLEGTCETVAHLLTPTWEINSCARCDMPVPMPIGAVAVPALCPCNDVPGWPNTELPLPRSPVNTIEQLKLIRDRLQQKPH